MKTHRIEIRIEGGRTYHLTAQHSEVLLEGDDRMLDGPLAPITAPRAPTRLTLKAFGVQFLSPPVEPKKAKKPRATKKRRTTRK